MWKHTRINWMWLATGFKIWAKNFEYISWILHTLYAGSQVGFTLLAASLFSSKMSSSVLKIAKKEKEVCPFLFVYNKKWDRKVREIKIERKCWKFKRKERKERRVREKVEKGNKEEVRREKERGLFEELCNGKPTLLVHCLY